MNTSWQGVDSVVLFKLFVKMILFTDQTLPMDLLNKLPCSYLTVVLLTTAPSLSSYIYISPQTISTQFLSLRHFVISPNLQFQAQEHSEEDKAETEEADGQADQPSEQCSLPGRIVELFTARYGTAALHPLQ